MNYALYTKLPPQPLRDSSPNLGEQFIYLSI